MKVKELIKELKTMPQNMELAYAHHDNSMGEIAGWVCSVHIEEEVEPDMDSTTFTRKTGKKVVMIRG